MAFRFDPGIQSNVRVQLPPYHLVMMNPGMRTMRIRGDEGLGTVFGDFGKFWKTTFERIPQMAVGAATGYATSGGEWWGAAAGAAAARTRKGKWLKFKVFPSAIIPGAIGGAVVGIGQAAFGGMTGGMSGFSATPWGTVIGKTGGILKGAWTGMGNVFSKAAPGGIGPPEPWGILKNAGDYIPSFAKSAGGFVLDNPSFALGVGGMFFAGGEGEPGPSEPPPEPPPERETPIECLEPPCPGDPVQVIPGPVYGPYLPPPDGSYLAPDYGGFDPYYGIQGGQFYDEYGPPGPFDTGSMVITQEPRAAQYTSPSLYSVADAGLTTDIMDTGSRNYYAEYLDGPPTRWPMRRRQRYVYR